MNQAGSIYYATGKQQVWALLTEQERQTERQGDGWMDKEGGRLSCLCVHLGSHRIQLFALAKYVFAENLMLSGFTANIWPTPDVSIKYSLVYIDMWQLTCEVGLRL